ncbi:succinate dehydrogenase assembly factor 2 [Avibacterium sp. 21-586]|uniref:FAD assembly factor SdhE n=1 Tax=Avibacterium sp. 21-586 TaxID=2911534 RepID=UPI0022478F93|nr:succinate dehydrogenase assembly factor 2 [Avibacterium sp. 21-586]MCW9710870.1 succinate dehydrogenase assembly factor 2 [Avibacterium sp. 21-586]
MTIHNKFHLEWACRRGMLELDKLIMPFFQQYFDQLSEPQKDTFVRLLEATDLELFSWFFNRKPAPDLELQQMVSYIQEKLSS